MTKTNFSLDIETLGVTPGSVIFAIGCVAFDNSGVIDRFYHLMNINASINLGFVADPRTLDWWNGQSTHAKLHLQAAYTTDSTVFETLMKFKEWVLILARDVKNVVMWGNGSEFDNAFLTTYYAKFNQDPPWYKGSRCLRTLKELFPGFEPASFGTLHNALDDAEYQARWITRILNAHAPQALPDYKRG